MAGFEPTTFRSQSGRATNLRHIPCRRRESTRPPPAPGGPVPPAGRPVRQAVRVAPPPGRAPLSSSRYPGTARTRPAWPRSLRGRSSMAEPLPSKQTVRVRFPSPAPPRLAGSTPGRGLALRHRQPHESPTDGVEPNPRSPLPAAALAEAATSADAEKPDGQTPLRGAGPPGSGGAVRPRVTRPHVVRSGLTWSGVAQSAAMMPRWYARANRRGTRTTRPLTRTGTRSAASIFHCERRARVLLRDILRLGTAIALPLRGSSVRSPSHTLPRRATSGRTVLLPRPTSLPDDGARLQPRPSHQAGGDVAMRLPLA